MRPLMPATRHKWLLGSAAVAVALLATSPALATAVRVSVSRPAHGATAADSSRVKYAYIYTPTWNNLRAGRLGYAQGIYGWRLNRQTGTVKSLGLVAPSPMSFDAVVASANGRYLYASEFEGSTATSSGGPFPGHPSPKLAAYSVNPDTGALSLINAVPTDGSPSYTAAITLDPSGRTLAVANILSGNIVTFRIKLNGGIGPVASNISEVTPAGFGKPHGLAFSPDERSLYVTDNSLQRVYQFSFDSHTSKITPLTTPYVTAPAGEGPRGIVVSANGKFVYMNGEEGGHEFVYSRAADGSLTQIQEIPIIWPPGGTLIGSGTTRISPDGRYLYINHRSNEDVGQFAIDQQTGLLSPVRWVFTTTSGKPYSYSDWVSTIEAGATSWQLDPSGRYAAFAAFGQNAVVLLTRNRRSGYLSTRRLVLPVPQPSALDIVVPTGPFRASGRGGTLTNNQGTVSEVTTPSATDSGSCPLTDAQTISAFSSAVQVSRSKLSITMLNDRTMDAFWRGNVARRSFQLEASQHGTIFYIGGIAARAANISSTVSINQNGQTTPGSVVNFENLNGVRVHRGDAVFGLLEFERTINPAQPFTVTFSGARTTIDVPALAAADCSTVTHVAQPF